MMRAFNRRAGFVPAEPFWIAWFAFAAALLAGLLLAFGTPLLSAPDELYHWERVVQISDGHFAPRKADGEWGGKIDVRAFAYQIWFFQQFQAGNPIAVGDAWDKARAMKNEPRRKILTPFPSAASFTPMAYLPQAAGVALARGLGANAFSQIMAGRLVNLAVFLALVAVIFRVLPAGRLIFLAAAVTPTALYLAASLSADPLNLTIPALLVALCVRLRADPALQLSAWRLTALAALVAVTALLKMPDILFGLALFLIPGRKFAGPRQRWWFVIGALALGLALAAAWNLTYPFVPGVFWNNGADPHAALRLLLTDPIAVMRIFGDTLSYWWFQWVRGYFGQVGGAGSFAIMIPLGCTGPILALLGVVALTDAWPRRDPTQAIIVGSIAGLFLLALLVAFFVGYTRSGSALVEGINGRYLFLVYVLAGWALASLAPLGQWVRKVRLAPFACVLAVDAAILFTALDWFRTRWVY